MAKRKAARARGRTKAAARGRTKARKTARTASAARARTAAARKRAPVRKRAPARARAKARRAPARRKTAARAKTAARKKPAARLRTASAGQARRAAAAPQARKAPALNRERRTIRDEGIVPGPPSSLDLDRSASSARSGRRELHEKIAQHTETSPALTGGDIDADWESAYAVGDEAPGGDNPTPDQDIVDDIGKAVGVQYEDNEELKGEKKIAERDKKRWELDPASSEDYEDR